MPETVKTWSVYLIQCGDGSLYCGMSNDVARRISEHQAQGPKCARYLRGKIPLQLVYQREIGSRSKAAREELRIKSLHRNAKLKLVSET